MLAVSGSLRAGSANTGLVRMAERLAPAGLAVTVRDGIDLLPYYNADALSSPSPSTTGAPAG